MAVTSASIGQNCGYPVREVRSYRRRLGCISIPGSPHETDYKARLAVIMGRKSADADFIESNMALSSSNME